MKRVAFLFVALFGILSFPSLSVAQPDPDAKFKKGGVVPGLGVISLDWAPASWSHSDSTSTYSAQISGSAGSNSASYTTSIQRFNDTDIVQTRHYIEVWIRSSATAHVTYSETATVNSSGVNGVASYGPLFSDNGNTFSRSGGASDVYSGSATVTYNADFADCGAGGYRRVVGSPLQLIASTTGGNNSPSSVATVDISVSLGTDTPVAVATGPFVSGILTVSYTHLTLPTNREV